MTRFANMPLEDILDEIMKHGHPKMWPVDLANAASPHLRKRGGIRWGCEVTVPLREGGDLYPYTHREHRFPLSATFRGDGATHREAAARCLADLELYLETGWCHVWNGHQDARRIRREHNIPEPESEE